jgi:hypothetical protein
VRRKYESKKVNVPQLFGEWKLGEFPVCPQPEGRLQMVFAGIKLEKKLI